VKLVVALVLAAITVFGAGFFCERMLSQSEVEPASTRFLGFFDAELPAYDTLEEAGVRASLRASQCSFVYECGGAIAQRPDGKFVVGPVMSSYSGDSVEVPHGVPDGWKLVADFHTHPCLSSSHTPSYFSGPDVANSVRYHIVGFVVDLCTGLVHEFDPSKLSGEGAKAALSGGYSTLGKIVGHITVNGLDLEPVMGL